MKRRGERYRLVWKQRLGFARMAIEHGCPIVPFGAVGADDTYDILLDAGHPIAAPVRALVERLGGRGDELPPIARGIGPTPVPRPERFYFAFGEPIATDDFAGRADDQRALRVVRDRTRTAVEHELARLLAVRDDDPERGLLPRLVAGARGAAPPAGSVSGPCVHPVSPGRLRHAARLPARVHRHLAHVGARAARARGAPRGARGHPRRACRRPVAPRAGHPRRARRRGRAGDGPGRHGDGPRRGQLARRLRRAPARGPRSRAVGRGARPGRRLGGGDASFQEAQDYFIRMQELLETAAPYADTIVSTPEGRRRATLFTAERFEHIPAELLAHQIRGAARCEGVVPLVEHAAREGWRIDAERIACPVRVVWGTADRLRPGRPPRPASATSGCRAPTGSSSTGSATAPSSTSRSRRRSSSSASPAITPRARRSWCVAGCYPQGRVGGSEYGCRAVRGDHRRHGAARPARTGRRRAARPDDADRDRRRHPGARLLRSAEHRPGRGLRRPRRRRARPWPPRPSRAAARAAHLRADHRSADRRQPVPGARRVRAALGRADQRHLAPAGGLRHPGVRPGDPQPERQPDEPGPRRPRPAPAGRSSSSRPATRPTTSSSTRRAGSWTCSTVGASTRSRASRSGPATLQPARRRPATPGGGRSATSPHGATAAFRTTATTRARPTSARPTSGTRIVASPGPLRAVPELSRPDEPGDAADTAQGLRSRGTSRAATTTGCAGGTPATNPPFGDRHRVHQDLPERLLQPGDVARAGGGALRPAGRSPVLAAAARRPGGPCRSRPPVRVQARVQAPPRRAPAQSRLRLRRRPNGPIARPRATTRGARSPGSG